MKLVGLKLLLFISSVATLRIRLYFTEMQQEVWNMSIEMKKTIGSTCASLLDNGVRLRFMWESGWWLLTSRVGEVKDVGRRLQEVRTAGRQVAWNWHHDHTVATLLGTHHAVILRLTNATITAKRRRHSKGRMRKESDNIENLILMDYMHFNFYEQILEQHKFLQIYE